MQKQQQYNFIWTLLLCCLVAINGRELREGENYAELTDNNNNISADSNSAEQPLRKPSAADFSDEDEDEDYGLNMTVWNDNSWDVLVFTQQWPVTTCYHWREQDPTHDCTLPQKKEFWTIHGVWPTKVGHFGPNFCNNSAKFDEHQLQTILDSLNTYWPDLEGASSQDWLWKHEWLKHGTCASLLDALNGELKYFGQGLKWREEYTIANILDAAGIHPDSNNSVVTINQALVRGLGKNPSIHCLFDGKHDISYLAEIRLCFNKSLELINCDGINRDVMAVHFQDGTVNTNCHISSPVHYPSVLPPLLRKQPWKFPVVDFYKLLQFLMWFTF